MLPKFSADLYVEKMRFRAVSCMSRSYRPTLPVSYIAQVLGFASIMPANEVSNDKDSDGVEECIEWLKAHGACLITDNNGEIQLDAKVLPISTILVCINHIISFCQKKKKNHIYLIFLKLFISLWIKSNMDYSIKMHLKMRAKFSNAS